MPKQIISIQELVFNYDRDQHITLQDLVQFATKHKLDFNTCKILSLNVKDNYIDSGNAPVIQQSTGDFHLVEDYLSFNTLVTINSDIYLTTH